MKIARTPLFASSLLLSLLTLPVLARAQANAPEGALGPNDGGPPAPPALETPNSLPPPAQRSPPEQAAPAQQPPPADLHAQGQGNPQAQGNTQAQATPPGQWVYTQQYGWLWMPYGDNFTYAPQDDQAQPYMYVYGPSLGWTWVAAPWVWGWGPYPFYGVYGPARYAWYGWGPRWHGGYYGGYFRGHYGYGGARPPYGAVRPAPPRAGYVGGAPAHTGAPAHVGRSVGGARGGHR